MITVLTPTYNRAHTLLRLYESLATQTDQRFEWLVVDDGSTDDTPALLESLLHRARFDVRVVVQNNSGKHVAINNGCDQARGDWILILDSDDALLPHAIEVIHAELDKNSGLGIMGICFRKSYFDGGMIGRKDILQSPLDLHPTEAGALLEGDLAYVFRKTSLKAHPFPVIYGEVFFPELYIWNKIGDDGNILFFPNTSIYLCEYLPDGYSANFSANLKRNPRGFFRYYSSQIGRERSMTRKMKCFIRASQCLVFILLKRVLS